MTTLDPFLLAQAVRGGVRVAKELDTSAARRDLMASPGIPKVLPAAEVRAHPHAVLEQLMVAEGIYVWPTQELAAFMAARGVEMEIGAGNGALAEYLGVLAIDNYSQHPTYRPEAKHRALWEQTQAARQSAKQALVTYGANVVRQEAIDAVIKHKPTVTYGLYIMHKYRAGDRDGNVFGVDEEKLIKRTTYIMAGNAKTHANKRILSRANEVHELDGLITRAADQNLNRIWIWNKTR